MEITRKEIAVCIPCYNEEENVIPLAEALIALFESQLPNYRYNIQFIDNCSTDQTRKLLRKLCDKYTQVRAIFNAKNFPATSGYYGLMQAQGDCVISIPADFQVPLELIPQMVRQWETGVRIVCLIKSSSQESGIMWHIRQIYYRIYKKYSEGDVLTNFTGSGLYDREFLEICKRVNDPAVSFFQEIISFGYKIEKISYVQPKRKAGHSKHNLWSLIDVGLSRFLNASMMAPRIATLAGVSISILSFIIGLVYLVLKLVFWEQFSAGVVPVVIGVFFIGAVQLFFIGLLGEYIMKINKRVMRYPLVVEETRINFDKESVQHGAENMRGDSAE